MHSAHILINLQHIILKAIIVKLIIDGGKLTNAKLDLKPGGTLRILNNGIIETRNGFDAPIGATVEISHGKIL